MRQGAVEAPSRASRHGDTQWRPASPSPWAVTAVGNLMLHADATAAPQASPICWFAFASRAKSPI